MKTKRFFARVSVVLAIIFSQSFADSSANQVQNVADSASRLSLRTSEASVAIYELDSWIASANQDLPRNDKVVADSAQNNNKSVDSSLTTFAQNDEMDSRESSADSSNSYFAPPQERFLAQADLAKRILGSANQNPIFLAQVEANSNSNAKSAQDSQDSRKDSHESTTNSLDSSLHALRFAQNDRVEVDSQDSHESHTDSHDSHDDYEVVDIGTSTIRARAYPMPYQSGASVDKSLLDSSPSGNGDITSILKILPNVGFDSASGSSNTPGEIDPAKISISGGLYYQNNFQLDGFNMNNDLDPAGGGTTDNQTSIRSGNSQGLNIDTSLLDSITVLDSNVSASYGGFSGGVVKAEVRKARKDGWHGNISYQFTQGSADPTKFSLTQYHIDDTTQYNQVQRVEISAWQRLWNSSSEAYQPEFTKHLVKSSLEGYITEKLGFVASFTTTQSFIPLRDTRVTDTGTYNYGEGRDGKREQKRQSYNYYLKAHYDISDYLTLEANIGYAPQYNTYYNDAAKDSYYAMESGGWQGGAKAIWQTSAGLWTNSFGYSSLENSRRGDADHFYQWFRSVDKNWGGTSMLVFEGGWGNVDQIQRKFELKSEFESIPLKISIMTNTLRFGVGIDKFQIVRDYLNDVHWMQGNAQRMTGNQHCGADSLGWDSLCSSSPLLQNGRPQANSTGQFATQIRVRPKGKYEYWGHNFNAYLEDDIRVDLGRGGDLNLRPGIRYDGDSYMGKHSIAPRFALNYITPAPKDWQTKLTFGANRYYGRNLFTYWLYAQSTSSWKVYRRSMCNASGTANGYVCSSGANAPSDWKEQNNYNLSSFFHFDKLKVPYDDELMGGITQNLGIFEVSLKYIHRFGRDEIMRQDTGGSSRADYYWNNNGSSQSQIIAFILQNIKPIETFGIHHHYLFAVDWTQTKRGYNIQFNTANGVDRDDDEYTNNGMIYYDGKLIRYRDRPVENFLRPWSLRLNTTHRFNVGRTRWMLNNFFRYRASFERMLANGGITINGENYPRYDKIPFKGAFNWDMRVGFEVDFYRGEKMRHTLYVNMDIFNVLNARNKTTMQGWNVTSGVTPGISSVNASTGLTDFAVYETGRQFWFQVGYKF